METSTIAIIILIATLILYAIPKMPLSVTTILAILAMVLFGVVDFASATSGFANNVVFLNAGMMIIGQAMVTTGLAQRVGNLVTRVNIGKNERLCIMLVLVVSTVLSVFINGAITVSIMMPIIDAIVLKSGGAISRKQTYMPLGIGSVIGNNVLTISATSMLTAVAMLEEMGYGTMSIFAPLGVNLPAIIVVFIFYALVGQKLQERWYQFDEVPVAVSNEDTTDTKQYPVWKQIVVVLDFLAVVGCMIAGVPYGPVCLAGAVVVILTGCISEKNAMQSVSWSTIIVIAGSLGISSGMSESGAGAIIANFFIDIAGPFGESGIGMCIILFFVGSIISDVMSDNASVAILLPIGAAISEALGINPTPIFLAICSGVKVGLATPICVTPMTMVAVPGYRFMDYLRMGGLVNLICMVVTCAMIGFIYF